MGLSVLIPVYNVNVTSLVSQLIVQLTKIDIQAEIILLDDGSAEFASENKLLQHIPLISFFNNEKNEGRMFSRQKLASLAKYNYLLFLDCDSEIVKEDFVSNYYTAIEKNYSLVCGGRIYTAAQPSDCNFMLHWKYGIVRESRSTTHSSDNPAFMSNNFLIKKQLFIELDYSFNIPGYGHEDSWWGIQFEKKGIECLFINNPVMHTSLEKSEAFLAKSENALNNLLLLEQKVDPRLLKKHIKIFRWFRKLKNARLAGIYIFFEKPFHNYLKKNLLSCKPKLFYFDCYRLATLIRLSKSNSAIK